MRSLGFTFDEIRGIVVIVMVGATELITYGMPRVLALLLDSGLMPRLRGRSDLVEQAVDEGFRLVTPSNVVLRAVTRDCEIEGHRVRRGERVLVVFHNIMRRKEYFPDPHRFDLERVPDPRCRRLIFGAGAPPSLGGGACALRGAPAGAGGPPPRRRPAGYRPPRKHRQNTPG